jgi:hypothetical protein
MPGKRVSVADILSQGRGRAAGVGAGGEHRGV